MSDEIKLGSYDDLTSLFYCQYCFGFTTGEKGCSCCGRLREYRKPVPKVKREFNPQPYPIYGGIHYTGRVTKVYLKGTWELLTVWQFEDGYQIFYPAACHLKDRIGLKGSLLPLPSFPADYLKVMDYLGEYLAAIDEADPMWRTVDVVNGEVLDTTNYGLIEQSQE